MKTLHKSVIAAFFTILCCSSVFAENYALQFDGQNDFVDCGEARELRRAHQNFTIECWFRTQSGNGEQVLITNRHEDDGSDFPSITIRNGRINFCVDEQGQRQDISSQNMMNDNRWHHVAGTIDGRTWTLYVDGQRDGQLNENLGLEGSNYNLNFGYHGAWNVYYPGEIDEVRIWLRTLSPEEIRANMNVMLSGDEEGLHGYWNFDEGEGQEVNDLTGNGNDGVLGANNQQGQDDPRWVQSAVPVYGGTITLAPAVAAFPPVIAGRARELSLLLTNTTDEEDDRYSVNYELTFPNNRPQWLTVAPVEGRVRPGEEVPLVFRANAVNLQVGQHNSIVRFNSNASNLRQLDIPVSILVTDGAGRVFGRVTDAENGDVFAGLPILTDRGLSTITDDEGFFEFVELPATNYLLRTSADDFLSMEQEVDIDPDEEVELNFALLHSEFDPRPATIEETLQTNDTLNSRLTIANPGNGPLAWSSVIDFPDELEQDPWTLRQSYPVSQITGDARIQAVTFAEDKIFLAGAADQRKLIYSVSRDGELLDTFRQFSTSNYGFASLTWDGEILWGAGDRIIYGFNTSGDSITSFAGPHNLSSNVVWDSDREVLWLASATSNIVSCDRAGNVQTTLNRRSMRIYGLGYYPEDPDGYPLYVFTNPTGNVRLVMKMDPDTGDTLRAALLPDDGGRPAGSAVTNLYDPYSWIFFGVSNIAANDVLYAWHLSAKTGWIRTSPQTGVVEAGSTGNVDIHFDAYGLTPELVYGTVLRFSHDGVGGMTEVPVSLSVTDVGGLTQRVIRLDFGWNLISTNLSPEGADDFAGLMSPLVESGQLLLAKDGGGHFYWPVRQFDGIEGWDGRYGYWLKVGGACELRLSGESLSDETAIPLEAGWNTVAYLPRQPTGAEEGFSGLGGNLVIARDGRGRFYLPAYGFNDLAPLHEGAGYQVRVREAGELIYSRGERGASLSRRYAAADEAWLESLSATTSQHNILIVSDLPYGTRLEALTTTGVVAGRGVVGSDGLAGLTLWGDDVGTAVVEGFANGEVARVVVSDGIPIPNSKLQIPNFPPFTDGGWDVVELKSAQSPVEFGIVSAYPNPFNSMLNLEFTLQRGDIASVILLDISGREVASYHAGRLAAGNHRLTIQGGNLASGIYVLRLESSGAVSTRKIVLTK